MVSYERMYQCIWSNIRAGGILYQHLRHIPKKYRKHYGSKQERGQIPNRVSINERPPQVESCEGCRHWEIDTVIDKSHDRAIVTLVDRTSRFTIIGKLIGKHAEPCARKVVKRLYLLSGDMV